MESAARAWQIYYNFMTANGSRLREAMTVEKASNTIRAPSGRLGAWP
jgi:hypothetical protein